MSTKIIRRFRPDGRVALNRVIEMPGVDEDHDFWTVIAEDDDPDSIMEITSFEEARPTTILVTLRHATPAEADAYLRERRCVYNAPPPRRSLWERVFG